jgi:hypothetical protein
MLSVKGTEIQVGDRMYVGSSFRRTEIVAVEHGQLPLDARLPGLAFRYADVRTADGEMWRCWGRLYYRVQRS